MDGGEVWAGCAPGWLYRLHGKPGRQGRLAVRCGVLAGMGEAAAAAPAWQPGTTPHHHPLDPLDLKKREEGEPGQASDAGWGITRSLDTRYRREPQILFPHNCFHTLE